MNVATVRPMSKIPTFGSSASASGIRPPTCIPFAVKRTLDKDGERTSKRQRVEPALETTVICDVPPATLMAKKKPASASSALQTRTTRQKAAATIARPAATARALPAASVTKPQPAKVTAAPVKRVGKADQAASKPAGQSSVFMFKGSQVAPAANGPATTARPAVGGKKRPAWDTKGRLEDMEVSLARHLEQNSSLQQQILSSNDRIAQLESMNCQLKGTVQQREEMTSQAHDEIDTLRRRLREKEEELESTAGRLNRQLADVEFARSTLERQKSSLESELSASQQEVAGLKSTVAQMSAAQAGIEAELSA